MKKLLFLLLLGATVQAQITTRCAVCPPTLNGVPNGYALRDSSGFARWQFVANDTMTEWGLSGNAGTNHSNNFIGTTDGEPFRIISDSTIQISAETLVLNDTAGYYAFLLGDLTPFGGAPSGMYMSLSKASFDVDTFKIDGSALQIINGTPANGYVLTSDENGFASWEGGITYDSLAALTGETVTLTNNSTNIIAASGTIVSVTWSFPAGVTGDVLDVENMQVITTLNITGTGTGTITAAKITNTKSAGLKTFHNYGGNWY
jgi:hypothetical protein